VLLKIEGSGSIKKATLRFGDITLLMGPPNTGKSYTLKMLYVKLFPLDEYTQKIFNNAVSNHIESSIFSESEVTVYHTLKLLVDMFTRREIDRNLISPSLNISIIEHDQLTVVEARNPISLNIDLSKILSSAVHSIVNRLLPAEYITSSVLEPADAMNGAEYIVKTLLTAYQLGLRNISSINTTEQLTAFAEDVFGQNIVRDAKVNIDMLRIQPTDKNMLNIIIVPNLHIELDAKDKELKVDPTKMQNMLKHFARRIGNMIVNTSSEAVSKTIYNALANYMSYATRLNNIRFIPSNRSTIMTEIEYIGVSRFKAIEEFFPVTVSSYAYWYHQGRNLFTEGKLSDWQRKLLKASAPLLEGSLEADESLLLYRDWRGVFTDMRTASTSVHSIVSTVFPLLTIDRSSLILVENPEIGLHPRTQILMGLFTVALPSLCSCRVVASTHSDLFATTIAQLAVNKPEKKDVVELIKKLNPHISDGVDELAEAVEKSVKNIDVRVYEYTQEGVVKQVNLESLLSERVPSITEVIDKLISWSSNLTLRRSDTRLVKVS